jgi:Zn-dependent protease
VRALTLHAFGGECDWEGTATEREEAEIALAGPLAQLVVLGLALVAPRLPLDIRDVLVDRNALLIAVNLLPIGPFDGATAIRLLRMRPRRSRRRPRDESLK